MRTNHLITFMSICHDSPPGARGCRVQLLLFGEMGFLDPLGSAMLLRISPEVTEDCTNSCPCNSRYHQYRGDTNHPSDTAQRHGDLPMLVQSRRIHRSVGRHSRYAPSSAGHKPMAMSMCGEARPPIRPAGWRPRYNASIAGGGSVSSGFHI